MIIVSCCNTHGGIFSVDENTLEVQPISAQEARGMAVNKGFLYVATHNGLQLYWQDLAAGVWHLIAEHRTKENWHGLAIKGGTVYAIAAQKNTLSCFDKLLCPADSEAVDLSHGRANDLCFLNGELYYCLFTKRQSHSGAVMQRSGTQPLVTGLDQPHSLHVTNGHIYICNSAAGEVRQYTGQNYEVILKADQYTRGLYLDEHYLWTGISKDRKANRPHEKCGVIRKDLATGTEDFIELPADEVYGIVKM